MLPLVSLWRLAGSQARKCMSHPSSEARGRWSWAMKLCNYSELETEMGKGRNVQGQGRYGTSIGYERWDSNANS